MSFFIGLLTVVLVVNCLLLILLVLVQLPKKEAGAGMAFGGAATDALFGAGSGNVLTKVTKYAAVAFFALTLVVAFLQSANRDKTGKALEDAIQRQAAATPSTPGQALSSTPAATNFLSTTAASLTNAPAAAPSAPATNK
jgi:preprotein translocase subunit SecG